MGHETSRLSLAATQSAGRPPQEDGKGCLRGHDARGSGSRIWRYTPGCRRLDDGLRGWRVDSPESQAARAAAHRREHGAVAGGPNCASHRGSMPRTTQAAFLPVDPRSGGPTDRDSLRHRAFGFDRRPISGPMGVQPAEAGEACSRAGSRGGGGMDAGHISSPPGGRKACGRPYLLGRRDGVALRSPGWPHLWPCGSDSGYPRHGETFWLQHDFRHHEPGAVGVHGLQVPLHNQGLSALFEAASQATERQRADLFDYRSASGPCGGLRFGVGGSPGGYAPVAFFAWLQPGTQPRRTAQPRRQVQRGRSPTRGQSERIAGQCPGLLAKHSASACHRSELLPGSSC